MATTTADKRPLPQIEDEQEINFRKYWRKIGLRWWLPAGGLLAGLIIGYLVALGSGKVWEANSLLYLGQPTTLTGSASLMSLNTNPSVVDKIVHGQTAIAIASARSGIPVSRLRSEISTQTITGSKNLIKTGQVPLYQITVTDRAPGRTRIAARSLSNTVIGEIGGFAATKIRTFSAELRSIKGQLAANQDRINHLNAAVKAARAQGANQFDQLVLVSDLDNAIAERGTLLTDQGTTQQEIALAKDVEAPKIVQAPNPTKTTARSTRTSMIIGALIGLILGIIAALVWEPLTARFNRPRTT
jgi:uncharacterized protein involved in exopolysaccharide biosynthesis